MKTKNNTGFTLIEMIIAIAIVGVMATAALIALNPLAQFQKANDARRKSDLSQVQKALENYYQDFGKYPDSSAGYKIDARTSQNPLVPETIFNWGSNWSPYMNLIPVDPSGKQYVYYSTNNGQTYYLYASLDRVLSTDKCVGSVANICNSTTLCGSNNKCNFGVSSPDTKP